MQTATWFLRIAALSVVISAAAPLHAQVMGGPWASDYSITNLGSVPGVPGYYGGVAFASGDPTRLLVGGNANTSIGAVYSIRVQRDAMGHVVGFDGSALELADAPFIDGGLSYAPNGVLLYTAFPINVLGQIRPGASGPSKTVLLSGLGVGGSVGGCAVVSTSSGATRLKLTSPGVSRWYDAPLTPDGVGTFNVGLATPRGPSTPSAGSMVFVGAGQPGFAFDTALVASCNGFVGAYSLDANRDVVASLGSFVLSLAGCADGMTLDPLTGDLLIGAWDLKRIYVVRGFDGIARYCAGTSSVGDCAPQIGWSGTPTLTGADDFVVLATNLPPAQTAFEIWSFAPTQVPFFGSFLCVAPPLRRIALVTSGSSNASGGASGGANPCAGALANPWSHAFFAANGLGAGASVFTQFAVRNPSASAPPTLLFSDALRFNVTH